MPFSCQKDGRKFSETFLTGWEVNFFGKPPLHKNVDRFFGLIGEKGLFARLNLQLCPSSILTKLHKFYASILAYSINILGLGEFSLHYNDYDLLKLIKFLGFACSLFTLQSYELYTRKPLPGLIHGNFKCHQFGLNS